jgi:hypothetical protein
VRPQSLGGFRSAAKNPARSAQRRESTDADCLAVCDVIIQSSHVSVDASSAEQGQSDMSTQPTNTKSDNQMLDVFDNIN